MEHVRNVTVLARGISSAMILVRNVMEHGFVMRHCMYFWKDERKLNIVDLTGHSIKDAGDFLQINKTLSKEKAISKIIIKEIQAGLPS